MTGLRFNERLAKWHFWLMFIAFNSTFLPLFALGMKGMPRRVSTYAPNLHGLNVWVSISAFVLGFSMLIFLFNVVYSLIFVRQRAESNPWRSKSIEWQVPTPGAGQQLRADPGVRLRPLRLRHAARRARRRPAGRRAGADDGLRPAKSCPLGLMIPPVPAGVEIPPEPPDVGARALSSPSRLLAGASTFFFLAFLFAYFYLRSLNQDHMWRPAHVKPDQGLRRGVHRLRRAQRAAHDRRRAGDEGRARGLDWAGAVGGAAARAGGGGAAVRRVHRTQDFGPTDGALRERVLRLDGLLPDRRARHHVLARDARRHRAARAARTRRAPSGDIKDPDRLIAPGLDAAVFYWVLPRRHRRDHLRDAVPAVVLATAAATPGLLGLVVRSRRSSS